MSFFRKETCQCTNITSSCTSILCLSYKMYKSMCHKYLCTFLCVS